MTAIFLGNFSMSFSSKADGISADATGYQKLFPGQPLGVVRGKKDGDGGDVGHLSGPAERSL
jgi:hypothetical protein